MSTGIAAPDLKRHQRHYEVLLPSSTLCTNDLKNQLPSPQPHEPVGLPEAGHPPVACSIPGAGQR